MDLYHEEILEHYRHPHNHGTVPNATITRTERNSSCGDELTFTFNVQDDVVHDVQFEGQGCAISQAAASMLTDELKGKTVEQITALQKEDLLNIIGNIELGPTRLKCALLSLQAVTGAAVDYEAKK